MYLFDFECQWCWWKEKIESLLEYRHNPLVVTATTEMNLAPSGFNTFIDYSRFIKNKNKIKKKKQKCFELTPRYQRLRPKYGPSALHLSSGRESKQAPSGAHETPHSAGIALFEQTVWGSNPHRGHRLLYFFLHQAIYDTICFFVIQLVRWD